MYKILMSNFLRISRTTNHYNRLIFVSYLKNKKVDVFLGHSVEKSWSVFLLMIRSHNIKILGQLFSTVAVLNYCLVFTPNLDILTDIL